MGEIAISPSGALKWGEFLQIGGEGKDQSEDLEGP